MSEQATPSTAPLTATERDEIRARATTTLSSKWCNPEEDKWATATLRLLSAVDGLEAEVVRFKALAAEVVREWEASEIGQIDGDVVQRLAKSAGVVMGADELEGP